MLCMIELEPSLDNLAHVVLATARVWQAFSQHTSLESSFKLEELAFNLTIFMWVRVRMGVKELNQGTTAQNKNTDLG